MKRRTFMTGIAALGGLALLSSVPCVSAELDVPVVPKPALVLPSAGWTAIAFDATYPDIGAWHRPCEVEAA
jgi:hypothetical protein